MFVRMDLSLKYSQKRNLFHFFEQKTKIFKSREVVAPPIYAPGQACHRLEPESQSRIVIRERGEIQSIFPI